MNYNPDNLQRIRAIDETFTAYKHLADVEQRGRFLMRSEVPYNHFVGFNRAEVIPLLTRGNNPPALHECIDGLRPFRLCFDIEREVDAVYDPVAYHAHCNAYAQETENLVAMLEGREPKQVPPIITTAEMFYSATVTAIKEQITRAIYDSLRFCVEGALMGAMSYAMDLGEDGAPIIAAPIYDAITIAPQDIAVFDSSCIMPRDIDGKTYPPKISFHVIFTKVFMCDYHEGRRVTDAVAQSLAEYPYTKPLADAIDRQVIRSNFFMRIPGSAKPREPSRILQAFGIPNKTLPEESTHMLLQQNIANIRDCVCVSSGEQPIRADIVRADAPDVIAQIIAKYPAYFVGYDFVGISYNIFRFTRVGDTPECTFCKRVHTNDNAVYVLYKHGRFYLKCRRMPRDRPHGIELKLADDVVIEADVLPQHLDRMRIVTARSFPSRTMAIDEEYIGELLAAEIIKHRTLLIKSPMGSGKTYALKSMIQMLETEPQKILMVSFRRAFTLEKAAELGFDHYLNYPSVDLPTTPARFICQYESFYRLDADYRPTVLIIDEIESINEQIQSFQDFGGLAYEALARLQEYVNAADYLVVMDANLSESSAKYFINERRNTSPLVIVNEFKRRRDVKCYASEANLTATIRERAQTTRVGVCSDSRTYLQSLEKMLIADGIPAEQIKVVTSDNSEEFQREIKAAGNITELVKRYRVFGYNTTLLAGISIEDAELSEQFACFIENFITPTGAFQLVGRVRAMTTLHIYAAPQNTVPTTFDQELARTFCLKSTSFLDMLRVGRKLTPLPRMLARNRVTTNNARGRLIESILALWQDSGAVISIIDRAAGTKSARANFTEIRGARDERIAQANMNGEGVFDKKLKDTLMTYDITTNIKPARDMVTKLQKRANIRAWRGLKLINENGSLAATREYINSALTMRERLLDSDFKNLAKQAQVMLERNNHMREVLNAINKLEAFGVDMAAANFTMPALAAADYERVIKQVTGEEVVKYAARKLNTELEHTFGIKITSTTRTKKGRGGYMVQQTDAAVFIYAAPPTSPDGPHKWFVRPHYEHIVAGLPPALAEPALAPEWAAGEPENVARVDPIEPAE
jgi:hypothetical protein